MYALIIAMYVAQCIGPPISSGVCAGTEQIQVQKPVETFKTVEACQAASVAKNVVALVAACVPLAEDRSWHVLVQTYGGDVSLLHDLTKHEADEIVRRLSPYSSSCNGCTLGTTADTVKRVEEFQ